MMLNDGYFERLNIGYLQIWETGSLESIGSLYNEPTRIENASNGLIH
jgi:hypothetical protein